MYVSDLIDRQQAIDICENAIDLWNGQLGCGALVAVKDKIEQLPSAEPQIIRCKDCKHNPKYEWFGCPMSHLSEAQRPETAWCWKAERRTDG